MCDVPEGMFNDKTKMEQEAAAYFAGKNSVIWENPVS
jgi:hypothetical protein